MHNVSNGSLTQPAFQQTMDYFSSMTILPATRLDADQYVAEDIDGVTESLFGSGNLNFLLLQAGQSNHAIATASPFSVHADAGAGETGWSAGTNFSSVSAIAANDFVHNAEGGIAGHSGTFSSESFLSFPPFFAAQPAAPAAMPAAESGGEYNYGGMPPVAAGSGSNGFGFDGAAGADGASGLPGAPGQDGTHGTDGANGAGGQDGSNGSGNVCGDTSIINIDLGDIVLGDVIVNLGDIILGDVTLGDIVVNLGDIHIDLGDLHLGDVNLGDVTTIVTDVMQTVIGDGLTIHLDAVLGTVTNLDLSALAGDTVFTLLDQIVDLSPVTDLLAPVLDLDNLIVADIHSIFSLLHDGGHEHRPGDTDIGIGLDTALGDLSVLNGVLDIAFDPLEDVLGDVDLLADIGLGLFQTEAIDNGAGDTDITLDLGLDLLDGRLLGGGVDIPLDPLERIVGDIDLDLGVAADLLGETAQGVVDHFAGGSGGETLLSGLGGTLSHIAGAVLPGLGGDSAHDDVAVDAGAGLFGHDIASVDIAEALDFAEPVTGDIDLAGGAVLDLFGGNETDNKAGDTDIDLDLDVNVLGLDIAEIDFIDVPLDPVEAVLGDIDLNVNAALDLLNPDCNDGGVQDLLTNNGGDGLLAWTESVLPDIGDLLGHSVDHGLGSVLPEPVGDMAEGLGGLLGMESSGGLFGGGGLFG